MSEEIKPWKPEDAVNAIRARIQAEFVAMIPEQAFHDMVAKEINDFMTETRDYYSSNTSTPFQRTIRNALELRAREEIIKVIDDPKSEWRQFWHTDDNGKAVVCAGINKFLTDNASKIITDTLGGMFQSVINQLRNRP